MATKQMAKTLITNPQPPWIHPTPTSTISNRKNPFLHLQIPKFSKLETRNWRIHAEAKGFNRAPAKSLQKINGKNVSGKIPERKNDDDNDEKIPQVVWNRMTTRILAYVGIPMAIGLVLLQIFSVIKEDKLLDVPIWLPFFTTFLTFGASALGIAYGTLSTSWEAEKEGSLLGFEQVQKNWVDMWNEEEDVDKQS